MTIASEISKLQSNLEDSYTAIQNKGGTIPQNECFDNLPDAIDSIITGGDITSLSITPSTSAQTFSKQGQYDGYNPVTVNAVTSAIDNNIQPIFIRNGIEILGVTGIYGEPYVSAPSVYNNGGVTAYITSAGKLYVCGDNRSGQQGSGYSGTGTEVKTFTKRADNAKKFYFNDNGVSVYLDNNNDLYMCGLNTNGQQGSGNTTTVTTFTKRGENVKDFELSNNASWYVTNNNELYGCGYNNSGQQGNNSTSDVKTFTKRGENIKEIITTSYETWYITNNNELYGCGEGSSGQQGNGGSSDVFTFTKRGENVKKFQKSSAISSSTVSLYLTNDGDLYGCGENNMSMLGISGSYIRTFTKIAENVKDFETSVNSTWYITNNNELYGCGSNISGQQGNGETSGKTETFTKRAERVKKVFLSPLFGIYWTAYITEDNELYATGGYEVVEGSSNISTFTKIADNVVSFGCNSDATAYYITTTKDLYMKGSNGSGQQGSGDTTRVSNYTKRAEKVIYFNSKSSTSWYINENYELFGCGNNYYGQQGSGNTTTVTTFTKRADL